MREAADPTKSPDRICYRVNEAFPGATGIALSTGYRDIAAGKLKAYKRGRCTIVMHDDLLVYLRGEAKQD